MTGSASQGEDLTLAEAVPLGTVLLQRLLADAGVRSFAIKGPAFVELGVRAPKESHDVDLFIHPADRAAAAACLTGAGWFVLGYDLPPEIDDIIYSTTYGHDMLPCTVDVHHVYPGLLADPGLVFEALWSERTSVPLAGAQVMAPAAEHALIIEALHRLRSAEEQQWGDAAERVVAGLRRPFDPLTVVAAADEVGARWSVAPVVSALGGARSDRTA